MYSSFYDLSVKSLFSVAKWSFTLLRAHQDYCRRFCSEVDTQIEPAEPTSTDDEAGTDYESRGIKTNKGIEDSESRGIKAE